MKHSRYFPGIEGLRVVFCLGIVIYHIGGRFRFVFSEWLGPAYRYGGYFGNYIFFIISGFLLNFRYMENADGGVRSYMAGKIRKLYPAYALSNLAAMVLSGSRPTALKTVSTFFMVSNGWFSGTDMPYNFPTWFLCVLLICDALYFGVRAVSRNHPLWYLPLCGGIAVWGMVLEKRDWRHLPLQFRTCGEGYMNFFLGVLLSELFLSGLGKKRCLSVVNAAVLWVSVIGALLVGLENMPGDMRWWVTLICANLVYMAAAGGRAAAALSCRPLRGLGAYSRDVFLWHIPVAQGFSCVTKGLRLTFIPPEAEFLAYFLLLAAFLALLHRLRKRTGVFAKTVREREEKS